VIVMLAAVTLLPALLTFASDRVDRLRVPGLGMCFGIPDLGNDPAGTTTRAAYEVVSRGFGPGANGPQPAGGHSSRPRSSQTRRATVDKPAPDPVMNLPRRWSDP
jgi:uncharacterized membrane protein YdfJ with MMPL/SSD domain